MKHPTFTRQTLVPEPFDVRIDGEDFTVRFLAGRMLINGDDADGFVDCTDLTITIVADPDPQVTIYRVADAVTKAWAHAVKDGSV